MVAMFKLGPAASVAAALLICCLATAVRAEDEAPLVAKWKVVELAGKPVDGPTLDYTSDKVSGTGGCNRFGGPIAIEDDAVKIGPLIATRMMCEGKMETETAYFAALEAARSFALEGDNLVLKGEDGGVMAKFTK
jgi:heat shock protein HslJ